MTSSIAVRIHWPGWRDAPEAFVAKVREIAAREAWDAESVSALEDLSDADHCWLKPDCRPLNLGLPSGEPRRSLKPGFRFGEDD